MQAAQHLHYLIFYLLTQKKSNLLSAYYCIGAVLFAPIKVIIPFMALVCFR